VRSFRGRQLLYPADQSTSIGVPATNPKNQNENTVYFRVFAQAPDRETLARLGAVYRKISLKHFHGTCAYAGGNFSTY